MLFFVDETWQKVGDHQVGALGCVGIRAANYNAFCRHMHSIKVAHLGATELTDSELKGQSMFSRAAFKRQDLHGDSHWLAVADEALAALKKYDARVFAVWTKNPELLTLRNPKSTELSKPYRQLLFDLWAYMRSESAVEGHLASIHFDERAHREDEATARAVSNYLIRSRGPHQKSWGRHFLTIPSFTASSISPGLQLADTVAYLAAQTADSNSRPELHPYVERIKELRYEYRRGSKKVRCLRQIV